MPKRRPLFALFILILSTSFFVLLQALFPSPSANQRFEELSDTLFRDELSANSITLHYTLKDPSSHGIRKDPITLGTHDTSTEAVCTASENCLALLKEIPYSELSKRNQTTYLVLEDSLKQTLKGAPYLLYEEPLRPITGIQSQLPVLLSEYLFYTESDINHYIALLKEVPNYFDSLIAFEQKKSDAGLFLSDDLADTLIEECNSLLKLGTRHFLFSSFEERLSDMKELAPAKKEEYLSQNEQAITDAVFPAYRNLVDALTKLKGTGKNTIGLCGLPDGTSYYEYLIKTETGSDRSISALETMIHNQIREDLTAMQQVLDSAEYTVSPKNNTDTPMSDLDSFSLKNNDPAAIVEAQKEKLGNHFPDAPPVDVSIKSVQPEMQEYLSPAFYMVPAIDHTESNTIYINKKYLPDDLELFTTLAHEGYPGHLYQTTYYASTNPAPLRSILGYGGYTEGWAVYAEMMSYYFTEAGKAQATLLQHNASVLLGLYALADIGIHYHGWTLMDTVSFFQDYGISDHDTVQKIYRLILGDPANYLKYYIGYAELLQLKRECIQKWGDAFSQKRFHKAVLDAGPMPFYLLHQIVLK